MGRGKHKKNKLEKISDKILSIKPSKDYKGKFLHFCSYSRHMGVLTERKAEDCVDKMCRHYGIYREVERYFGQNR